MACRGWFIDRHYSIENADSCNTTFCNIADAILSASVSVRFNDHEVLLREERHDRFELLKQFGSKQLPFFPARNHYNGATVLSELHTLCQINIDLESERVNTLLLWRDHKPLDRTLFKIFQYPSTSYEWHITYVFCENTQAITESKYRTEEYCQTYPIRIVRQGRQLEVISDIFYLSFVWEQSDIITDPSKKRSQ